MKKIILSFFIYIFMSSFLVVRVSAIEQRDMSMINVTLPLEMLFESTKIEGDKYKITSNEYHITNNSELSVGVNVLGEEGHNVNYVDELNLNDVVLIKDGKIEEGGELVTLTSPIHNISDSSIGLTLTGMASMDTMSSPVAEVSLKTRFSFLTIDDRPPMDIFVEDVSVIYDGARHGIDVQIDQSDALVSYRSSEADSWSTTQPSLVDTGTYDIYFKVSKQGYASYEGKASVTILPKTVNISGVKAKDREYDGTVNAEIDMSQAFIDGSFIGDDVSIRTGTAKFDSRLGGINRPVTFSDFSLEGSKVNNYSLAGQPTDTTASIVTVVNGVEWLVADDSNEEALFMVTYRTTGVREEWVRNENNSQQWVLYENPKSMVNQAAKTWFNQYVANATEFYNKVLDYDYTAGPWGKQGIETSDLMNVAILGNMYFNVEDRQKIAMSFPVQRGNGLGDIMIFSISEFNSYIIDNNIKLAYDDHFWFRSVGDMQTTTGNNSPYACAFGLTNMVINGSVVETGTSVGFHGTLWVKR